MIVQLLFSYSRIIIRLSDEAEYNKSFVFPEAEYNNWCREYKTTNTVLHSTNKIADIFGPVSASPANIRKNIFACLFSVHHITSLSRYEQDI